MALDYTVIADQDDFSKKISALSKRGKVMRKDFVNLATAVVPFFYGKGTENIQIINDVVNVAYDSGMNGGHIIDWFGNIIGHKVRKQAKNKRRFEFGKKDDTRNIQPEHVDKFLSEHSNPFEWGAMGNTTPKDFDPVAFLSVVGKKLLKNDVDIKQWADELAKAAEKLEEEAA